MRDHTVCIYSWAYTTPACMFYPSNIQSAGDYLILSMLWRFFFCRALKHSGRLIKSVPQAAALIGSHAEKRSPSLSYITRKMRGCFEVHQSYCFFPLAPSTEGSWCPNAGTAQRRGEIKEAYSNCAACTECIAWVGVPSCTHITLVFLLPAAPLGWAISSLLLFESIPQAEVCSKRQKPPILDSENESVIFTLTH